MTVNQILNKRITCLSEYISFSKMLNGHKSLFLSIVKPKIKKKKTTKYKLINEY